MGGFENTMELKPMKYKETINGPDEKAWEKKIENEHERMVCVCVISTSSRGELPSEAVPTAR